MKRTLLLLIGAAVGSAALFAQSVPEINYDANADISRCRRTVKSPAWRPIRAATSLSTRGPDTRWRRSATSAPSITAARGCFNSIPTGKFVREIGQGVYAVNFAQQVRVDPQDNVWIVDAGSNQVVKFDADGRFQLVLGRKPENITLRPGPGVSATAADAAFLAARGGPPAAGGGGGGGGGGNAGRPAGRGSTATASIVHRT